MAQGDRSARASCRDAVSRRAVYRFVRNEDHGEHLAAIERDSELLRGSYPRWLHPFLDHLHEYRVAGAAAGEDQLRAAGDWVDEASLGECDRLCGESRRRCDRVKVIQAELCCPGRQAFGEVVAEHLAGSRLRWRLLDERVCHELGEQPL